MSEYDQILDKAIAEAESIAEATEKKPKAPRESTVRFTIGEARLLLRALEKYAFVVAGYDDIIEETRIAKLEERIKKFIAKFSNKESSNG